MLSSVVIENVVLRDDDLNVVWSPWRDVNRANNQRLFPVVLGMLGVIFALGFLLNPSPGQLIAVVAPMLLGWLGFIWATNTLYLGAFKKAYAATPVGDEPCTFTFDANGMHQTMSRGTSSFRWSAFVEVVEDSRGVRLWMTPSMAVFIPARFIGETQAAELRLVDAARERGDLKGAPQ